MLGSLLPLVAGAIATMLLGPAMADDDHRVMRKGRVVPEVQRVWRLCGYGYGVRLEARGPEPFHIAAEFCYRDPRGERDPDGIFTYYRQIGSGTVAFSNAPGDSRYVFDPVPRLPAACTDRTPWTQARIAAL